MITMITHMRVSPENAPAYEALMSEVCATVLKKEPGVPYYAFARSAELADTYVVIEVYRDVAAHSAHMETDWVRESLPRVVGLIDGKFDIKQYVSPGTEPVRHRVKA